MAQAADLLGVRFGRLTVVGPVESREIGSRRKVRYWGVLCTCGSALKMVSASNLVSGEVCSCGCLKTDIHTTHGLSKHPLYRLWQGMLSRCSDPGATSYHRYGGRGIKVCKRWLSFENFLRDMGERPEGTSLERRKNNRGYSLANCFWATAKQQGRNRVDNIHVVYRGRRMTLAEASERSGIHHSTLKYRIAKGWTNPFQTSMYKPT